jgi:hypothetical protein
MAIMGSAWGKCPRCGCDLISIISRQLCSKCQEEDRKKKRLEEQAEPENLLDHPDLAELDLQMKGFYDDG